MGPEVGRFRGMDSWKGNIQNPVTLHKYLYGNNAPAEFVDPSGNMSLPGLMARLNVLAQRATSTVQTVSFKSKVLVNFARAIPIRIQYVKRVRDLWKLEEKLRRNGASPEKIAKRLNFKRRALGRLFKKVTPQPFRDLIYKRNSIEYNDMYGPTWQALREKGYSWETIIVKARSPGDSGKILSTLLRMAWKL